MNVFPNGIPSPTAPADEDLAQQARPGHGVPSQDPEPAAQQLLSPEESAREAKSAYMGGGMMVGAAAGAAVGVAVAGPVGAVVGGTIGAVTGAGGGAAVGATTHPEAARDIGAMPVDAPTTLDDTVIDPTRPRVGDVRE